MLLTVNMKPPWSNRSRMIWPWSLKTFWSWKTWKRPDRIGDVRGCLEWIDWLVMDLPFGVFLFGFKLHKIPGSSKNAHVGGDQTMQIWGKFHGFPLYIVWVGNVVTPVTWVNFEWGTCWCHSRSLRYVLQQVARYHVMCVLYLIGELKNCLTI